MDCRSCGVVNAPERRYCRECGARLGQPCGVCTFFNAHDDRHCGGCGRRLAGGAPAELSAAAYAPALTDAMGLPKEPPAAAGAGMDGQGVSQSEIDGLFENILEDEAAEGTE